MKINAVTRVLLRRWWTTVVYVVGGVLFATVVIPILTGDFSPLYITKSISSTLVVVVFVSLMALPIPVYRNFALFNQLGISRRTYWVGRTLLLAAYTVLATVILILNGAGTVSTSSGIALHGPSWLWYPILFLLFYMVTTSAMAGGNFLGLFARSTQFLIIFLTPVVLLILFTNGYFLHLMGVSTWIGDLIKLAIGYSESGRYYPINMFISGTLYNVIMLAISYQLNRLLKVRRNS